MPLVFRKGKHGLEYRSEAEMERKAAELGIKVDKRWSDKTLAERIDEALKG